MIRAIIGRGDGPRNDETPQETRARQEREFRDALKEQDEKQLEAEQRKQEAEVAMQQALKEETEAVQAEERAVAAEIAAKKTAAQA